MDETRELYTALIIIGAVGLTILLFIVYFNEIIGSFISIYSWLANFSGDLTDFNSVWDWIIVIVIVAICFLSSLFSDRN